MGRPKLYATAAEKHRAYRARRAQEMELVNRASLLALEARVERLAAAVAQARKAGCVVAGAVRVETVHVVLDDLAAWFEAQGAVNRQ